MTASKVDGGLDPQRNRIGLPVVKEPVALDGFELGRSVGTGAHGKEPDPQTRYFYRFFQIQHLCAHHRRFGKRAIRLYSFILFSQLFCRNKSLSNQGYLRLMLVLGEGEKNFGLQELRCIRPRTPSSWSAVERRKSYRPSQPRFSSKAPTQGRPIPDGGQASAERRRFRISVSPRKTMTSGLPRCPELSGVDYGRRHLIPQTLYIALSPQGLPRCELHFEKTAILEPGVKIRHMHALKECRRLLLWSGSPARQAPDACAPGTGGRHPPIWDITCTDPAKTKAGQASRWKIFNGCLKPPRGLSDRSDLSGRARQMAAGRRDRAHQGEGEVVCPDPAITDFSEEGEEFREKLSAAPKSTIASRWPQARSIRAAHAKEETANSRFRSR